SAACSKSVISRSVRQSRDFTTLSAPTMAPPGLYACLCHSCSLTVERASSSLSAGGTPGGGRDLLLAPNICPSLPSADDLHVRDAARGSRGAGAAPPPGEDGRYRRSRGLSILTQLSELPLPAFFDRPIDMPQQGVTLRADLKLVPAS